MSETKKLTRKFILIVIWTLFVAFTLCGLVSAGEKTEYIRSGKEPQTVKINNNLAVSCVGQAALR